MPALSTPLLQALKRVHARLVCTADVNRGNARRSFAVLFRRGLITWDPVYRGTVVLTAEGTEALRAVGKIR